MRITLEQWYAQPVHCPFCGCATEDAEPTVSCRHWLYTAYSSSLTRSDRFNEIADLPKCFEYDDEMSSLEQEKYGSIYDIIENNKGKIFNLVEFDLPTPSDGTLIAFAPIEDELVIWGRDHISPYED